MYSNAYVWSRVLSYLEQHSPAMAIASYFDDAEVIELTESKLVIYSPPPFRKDVIVKRYIDQIREAMRDQFQTEVEVVVLDETELPQYSKNKKNRNFVEFNSQYTFDKFVVGSSNQHAFSAARAVADNPADAYNPLFIYGESGLGKTHLLYAIANQIQREHPDYNIVYIKGDQFTNELIDAVRSGKNFEFRDKYRNADLFLMDDIQFIAGKDATQEEFFHTFNSLYENKRQIVLTSDRVPGDMVRLEDRLRTRFEWGLIVDVQPPDYETRFIITREKALELGIELPQFRTTFAGTRQDPAERAVLSGLDEENFAPVPLLHALLRGMADELSACYRAALKAGCAPAGRLLGSGNGLRRNPALQRAVERSFGLPLTLAAVPEEAACGAALFARMGMQEAF